jgi:hypothetical protein
MASPPYTIGFASFAASPRFDFPGDPVAYAAEVRDNFDHSLRWLLAGITGQA